MKVDVRFYEAPDGSKPVAEYLRELERAEKVKLATAFWKIQEYGFQESGVTLKAIEGKLWEIKVSAQRAFYCLMDGQTMIVLHAYRKKSQKAPVGELDLARSRLANVLGEQS